MKKLTTTLKRKIIIWGMALTLIAIPVSAFASYMLEPVAQKTQTLTMCESGECKVVAEITPPPVPRYEIVAKDAFTKRAEPYVPLTEDERLRREIAGKEYMRLLAKYSADDGKISAFERILIMIGV